MERLSSSISRLALVVALVGLAGTRPVEAQDDLDRACTASLTSACYVAAAAVRTIQPRVGLVLWGGSPVPGTASTVGLRLRSSPRISLSGRVALAPVELPPLLDRTRSEGERGVLTAASVQTTVGVVHGLSLLPTVGGFLSVDIIARASLARAPVGKGFDRGAVRGLAAGARLGLLRESLTLPGLSVTATWGRSTTVVFGDPDGTTTDGAMEGAVTGLNITGAVSRRLLGLRLGGGVSYDRYGSDVTVRYPAAPAVQAVTRADAVTHRWSGFGTLTWTRLIYHAVLELGWQEAPVPAGVMGLGVDPASWWASVSLRLTP